MIPNQRYAILGSNEVVMRFNTHVARQDRRVVQTRMPKRSNLRMRKKLIEGIARSSPIGEGGRS